MQDGHSFDGAFDAVAARLCLDPSDYPWTSHRAYRNGERIPWLTKAEVLAALERRDRNVARAYRTLMSGPQSVCSGFRIEGQTQTFRDEQRAFLLSRQRIVSIPRAW
jgi:hypothetical protein